MPSAKVSKNIAIGAGVTGILLLCCGLACCICGFVWLKFGGLGAHGIWSGIGLLSTGALGVVVLATRSKPVMVFFLVFCIIDMIINAIQAIIAAIVAALLGILKNEMDKGQCHDINGNCWCPNLSGTTGWQFSCDDITVMHAVFQAITAFSVIGIIATFTGSIIGCIGACCERGTDQPGVVVIQQGAQPQTQMHSMVVQTTQQQQNPGYPQQNPGYPQQNPGYPQQNINAGYTYPPPPDVETGAKHGM